MTTPSLADMATRAKISAEADARAALAERRLETLLHALTFAQRCLDQAGVLSHDYQELALTHFGRVLEAKRAYDAVTS